MKSKKLFLSLGMFFLMVLVLCSCGMLADATSIEISEMPKATYEVGEEIGDFSITVYYSDGSSRKLDYTSSSTNGIKVSNFDTTTVGTKTATVKYLTFIATFEYTVIATSDFAGGNGTAEAPYIIVNTEQFVKIAKDPTCYYKLGNDLDLSSVEEKYKEGWFYCKMDSTFSGVLDGGNYTISFNNTHSSGMSVLFYDVKDATIKNLNVETEGGSAGLIANGSNLTLQNVNRYGSVNLVADNNNEALYIVYPTENIVFDNCDNYASIYGEVKYIAPYLGYVSSNGNFSFSNCENYGDIYGQNVAMFLTNGSTQSGCKIVLNIKDCDNRGILMGVESNIHCAIGLASLESNGGSINDEKASSSYTVKPIKLTLEGYATTRFAEDKALFITNTSAETLRVVVTATYYSRSDAGNGTLLHALSNEITLTAGQELSFGLYNYLVINGESEHHSTVVVGTDTFYVHNVEGYTITDNTKLNFSVFMYNEANELVAAGTIK